MSGVVGGIGSGSFMRLLCSLEVVAVEYVLGLLISEHQHHLLLIVYYCILGYLLFV